jgi:hypothetical protein
MSINKNKNNKNITIIKDKYQYNINDIIGSGYTATVYKGYHIKN